MVSMAGLPFNQLIHLLQTDDDQRTRSDYMWSMRDGSMHEFMTAADSSKLWRYIHEPLLDLPAFDETMQRETQAAFAVPGAIDAGIDWYRANIPERDQLAAAEPWPSADARTAVPVLQIWGEDDGTFSPRFMDELGRYADDVTVLRIPGGRHWPMLEAPTEVHAAITHPVLSGPALKRIAESPLDQVIVADTIPLRPDAVDMGKLHVVSVAAPIGEAIRRINNEESVSSLF